MKLDRKIFFRIHSWIGIKLSILFFIVCFSGTMATLSHELDWLFIPETRASYQETTAEKNTIVDNIRRKFPTGKIIYWAATAESYLCDIVYVNIDEQLFYVFANPYTGEIQGKSTLTFQRFFRDLHYYLFIPFQVGHFTVLIFGFMLFVSTVTALFFYKKWYRKLFELSIGKGRVVFFRSLHRLVGVWSIPFTMLFSITGIWYFIERTNIGNVSRIANTRTPKIEELTMDSVSFARLSYTIDYNKAVRAAKNEIQGLVIKDILPPSNTTSPIYLTGISDVPLVRNRANRVFVHPVTYDVVTTQRAEDINTVTWLNDIADPLHFGYWGGLITKIIWFLGGLSISALVLTGIWISLERKVKNKKKAKAQKMGIWRYVNWLFAALMLGFMYYILLTRYNASMTAMATITLGWIMLSALSWYLFVYKIHRRSSK